MRADEQRRAIWIKLATSQIAALDSLSAPVGLPRTFLIRAAIDKGIAVIKADRKREARRDAARAAVGD